MIQLKEIMPVAQIGQRRDIVMVETGIGFVDHFFQARARHIITHKRVQHLNGDALKRCADKTLQHGLRQARPVFRDIKTAI